MRELNSKYLVMCSIVVPFGNKKDLEKIPDEMKKGVNFYPVKTLQEVLAIAFPTILDKVPSKL